MMDFSDYNEERLTIGYSVRVACCSSQCFPSLLNPVRRRRRIRRARLEASKKRPTIAKKRTILALGLIVLIRKPKNLARRISSEILPTAPQISGYPDLARRVSRAAQLTPQPSSALSRCLSLSHPLLSAPYATMLSACTQVSAMACSRLVFRHSTMNPTNDETHAPFVSTAQQYWALHMHCRNSPLFYQVEHSDS